MSKNPMQWYQSEARRDAQVRRRSMRATGETGGIFLYAMNNLSKLLESIAAVLPANDAVAEAKFLFAAHAYSLLWNAWWGALSGYYGSAWQPIRAFDECREYLLILRCKPEIVDDLRHRKGTFEQHRAILKSVLENLGDYGRAVWDQKRKSEWAKHKLAHATLRSIGSLYPGIRDRLDHPGQGDRGAIRAFDRRTVIETGVGLAEAALDLLDVVVFSFEALDDRGQMKATNDHYREQLRLILAQL
ncbi:MAG: hypothetical protein ACE5JL_03510 [Dehalococcoidia bacterium]